MLKIDTYPVGFNIRQIQDVIHVDHSEKFKIEGAILFLDFTI